MTGFETFKTTIAGHLQYDCPNDGLFFKDRDGSTLNIIDVCTWRASLEIKHLRGMETAEIYMKRVVEGWSSVILPFRSLDLRLPLQITKRTVRQID